MPKVRLIIMTSYWGTAGVVISLGVQKIKRLVRPNATLPFHLFEAPLPQLAHDALIPILDNAVPFA
jgi:hypothetical protein